jgi:tRNA threonylcarbamoyladenosine biosynthesis protein TsaB
LGLTLAFDTATSTATAALVSGGELLGERASQALRVLADADELVRAARAEPHDLERVVVGVGPGSFTGIRLGLAAARSLAFALAIPLAGVSTLEALAAGAPGGTPVIDGGRREVFVLLDDGPAVLAPHELDVEPGTTYVGDGAVRYREVLEAAGAEVPPDEDERHLPRARYHVELAGEFGPPDAVQPLYLRVPDAEARR